MVTRAPAHRSSSRALTRAAAALLAAMLLGCSGQAAPAAIVRPVSVPAEVTITAAVSPEPAPAPAPAETTRSSAAAASIERTTAGAAGTAGASPAIVTPSQGGQAHAGFPPPPPKTTPNPPTASGVARMRAPRLGVDHHIEDVGIVDGAMETPADSQYGIGWYRPWDKPGVAGNAVFSAHETWNHMQGPFYGMHEARPGDEITLDLAGGGRIRYRVLTNVRYAVDTMPMPQVLWPTARPPGGQWITLITCGGRLVYDESGFGEYLDRDVVVAQRFE